MLSPELLSTAVATAKKSSSPSGVSCYYVPINQYWGVKVYYSEAERDFAVYNQTNMYKVGYAPKVGSSFEVSTNYCYVTEAVELLTKYTPEEKSNWKRTERETLERYPNHKKDIDTLCENMRTMGFDFSDAHIGNFGYLNGFLVCIDFGY